MTDYRIRAQKMLKQIFPYIQDCAGQEGEVYETAIECFNREHNRNVHVAYGYTRVVFITSDYVIKTNITADMKDIEMYGGCEDEVIFYQFAKEQGFAHLLAEITPFEYMGQKFYIMPRIRNIGKVPYAYGEQFLKGADREFANKYLRDLHDENYGWYRNRIIIFDYAINKLMLISRGRA